VNRFRRPRVAALLLAGAVVAAGCSDGGDASDITATTAAGETTTVTTEPPATTTVSTVPPTTVSTTTTSTSAPTTTVDEIAATERAVAKAAVQSRKDYLYAVRHYNAPNVLRVLRRTHAAESPSLELALDNMETLRSNGWRARPDPGVPSTLTPEGEVELLDGPPATRAELTVCVIDSGVVYEPGGAPDGSDAIVNDEIVARRSRITMVLEDGAWKLFEGTALGEWVGETVCPAGE
jgi:hypothetical protein